MAARVLLTGGTAAARRLAEELVARLDGVEIIYALAGLTDTPRLPEHARIHVRQGGFGGAEGLAAWLRQEGIAAVIDATHPFARAMPRQVVAAARITGLPHARFLPPAPVLPGLHWQRGRERLLMVDSLDEMARALPYGARVVAALGSRGLAALAVRADLHLHARMLLPPAFIVPPRWRLLTGQAGRPRATLAREMAWLKATQAQWLLARHAQGSHALVLAALRLGITVVLQRCPAPPAGALVLEKPQEVLRWLRQTVLPLHR